MGAFTSVPRLGDVPQDGGDGEEKMEVVKDDTEGSLKTKAAFDKLSGVGDAEIDEEGAVAILEECTEEGNSESLWMLGLCREYGIGTKQDSWQALSLFRKSKEAGNAVGEFLLKNYHSGKGIGRMKTNDVGS